MAIWEGLMQLHDRQVLKERALEVLQQRVGKANAITMTRLAGSIQGCAVLPSARYEETRLVRSIIEQLRREGHPVCHHNGRGGGYFWAANEAELEETAAWFRKRAMSAFRQEANLKRISLAELVEQLRLTLDHSERMQDHLANIRAHDKDQADG
jgi:hypothetical protein